MRVTRGVKERTDDHKQKCSDCGLWFKDVGHHHQLSKACGNRAVPLVPVDQEEEEAAPMSEGEDVANGENISAEALLDELFDDFWEYDPVAGDGFYDDKGDGSAACRGILLNSSSPVGSGYMGR